MLLAEKEHHILILQGKRFCQEILEGQKALKTQAIL